MVSTCESFTPVSTQRTVQAVKNSAVDPDSSMSCSRQFAGIAGLVAGCVVPAAATWSPPMTMASGYLRGHGLGLGLGQPKGPRPRRLARPLGLVHAGLRGVEGQAEAPQQGGAIA